MQGAERQCDLVGLIMQGNADVESWLIAHEILPALASKELQQIELGQTSGNHPRRAILVPLPDGSAFGCNDSGKWMALNPDEAIGEIQYIGFRYASGNRWTDNLEVSLTMPGGVRRVVEPFDVARLWQDATGQKPQGFDEGLLDKIEALGYSVVDKLFNTQGRLGI